MDRKYIESEHIVDRYLSGDLTVREAREFEKYCLDNPDVLRAMPIPVRLKARLARRPGSASETGVFQAIPSSTTHAAIEASDEGFDEVEEEEAKRSFGGGGSTASRGLVIGLGLALLGAIGGIVFYAMRAGTLEDQLSRVQTTAQIEKMEAPTDVKTYRLQMSNVKPQGPTLALGWLKPPLLLDIYVDVSEGRESKYSQFTITIEKVNEGQLMKIHRVARDSNRELHLLLNSSAFGPGIYLLRFDGYAQSRTQTIGWVRIDLE